MAGRAATTTVPGQVCTGAAMTTTLNTSAVPVTYLARSSIAKWGVAPQVFDRDRLRSHARARNATAVFVARNCASRSSQSVVRMDAGLTTLIQANVSEVWDAWVEWSEDNGLRKGHSALGDDGERFAHGVAITPFWRFPDDVVVQFTPQGDATAIALYSASRLGVGDLGVNPDRLEDLHASLVAVQATS